MLDVATLANLEIFKNNSSLLDEDSSLESFILPWNILSLSCKTSLLKRTAAATTGPASAPRPTSSTPTIRERPSSIRLSSIFSP